ncbi:MEKHLA domain-containing protein [Pectobacterium carotovorum]|nr:MEKHLA domain-containing protein [Pectobacterium carotovorum]
MLLTLLEKMDSCYLAQSGSLLPSPADLANRFALACFGCTEAEMLALPSRLSTETALQPARQKFLENVSQQGIVYGYSGVRVRKNDQTFPIYGGVVWQLHHQDGTAWGMAARASASGLVQAKLRKGKTGVWGEVCWIPASHQSMLQAEYQYGAA